MLARHARLSFAQTPAMLMLGVGVLIAPAQGQETKLLPNDGAAADYFGYSIAFDSGLVAVGAWGDDDNGANSGSAYLFDAATGTQIAKLLPSDGAASDYFGYSIAIDNGVVAVGARNDDDNGADSGSAYLFDASTGVQLAKLLPEDGAAGDRFGNSAAIDNGVVAIGASTADITGSDSGSVYLFDASTGMQLAKLLPDDGAAGDRFGWSIAINNGLVVVGAFADDENGSLSGSAYVFDAVTGVQLAKLLPEDGAAGDRFGNSVAIDNGVVAVGARDAADSGSAYLFDAATGVQLAKLLPDDGSAFDYFGYSIAIDNGVVAVGALYDDDNGTDSGSVYVFDTATGLQYTPKLLPSDGAAFELFGASVAIDNGVVAVGASGDDDNGGGSGSAYLIAPGPGFDADGDGIPDWREIGIYGTDPFVQDTDGDGLTDGLELNTLGTDPLLTDSDFDGVIDPLDKCHGGDDTLDADGDGIPDACDTAPACPVDINGDGILDNGDIITFVQLFLAGC